MNRHEPPQYLWEVLEAQADDMFALYQLAQLLAEATDLDELVHLALPQLVRVCDSPYAALFLQTEQEQQRLELVAWIGSDFGEEGERADHVPSFAESRAAEEWFRAVCGLNAKGCLCLTLDVGRAQPGVLTLATPGQDDFSRPQRHLLATMAREVARALQLALARSDLQRRQRRIERMQSDFVTTVSHELRTPLARIQGYVDSLHHLKLSPEQQRRFIEDIGQSTTQLTHIVDTILDFSKVEEGRIALKVQAVGLARIVEQATREIDPAARARVRLEVPHHMQVQVDPERLVQVVTNVLTNALKYSPQDKPVLMRAYTRPARGTACLVVRDWGQGIPPEDQPYLFSKFFRARNVRESSLAGTGLGLYICKRLIEAQGGAIRLRSRLGSGTVVRICIPLA